tara:strand:+ start:130 stop:702 length:573 start_codon:yes stop_codon:yes gene_type:complete
MYDKIIYWKYDRAIDEKTCKKIVKLSKKKWNDATLMGEDDTLKKVNLKTRDSKTCWVTDQWLYNIVFDFMNDANVSSGWNFEINGAEDMQLTKYKKGGFYNYHHDGDGFTQYNLPDNEFLHNKTRKLSMTIVLNDEYEGGEFQFFNDKVLIKEKQGTVIVFPSYMLHRVRPVKSGIRYSLVVWFLGPPLH